MSLRLFVDFLCLILYLFQSSNAWRSSPGSQRLLGSGKHLTEPSDPLLKQRGSCDRTSVVECGCRIARVSSQIHPCNHLDIWVFVSLNSTVTLIGMNSPLCIIPRGLSLRVESHWKLQIQILCCYWAPSHLSVVRPQYNWVCCETTINWVGCILIIRDWIVFKFIHIILRQLNYCALPTVSESAFQI